MSGEPELNMVEMNDAVKIAVSFIRATRRLTTALGEHYEELPYDVQVAMRDYMARLGEFT